VPHCFFGDLIFPQRLHSWSRIKKQQIGYPPQNGKRQQNKRLKFSRLTVADTI